MIPSLPLCSGPGFATGERLGRMRPRSVASARSGPAGATASGSRGCALGRSPGPSLALAPAARGSSPLGDSSRCDLTEARSLAWTLAALSLPQREAPPLWESPRAATRALKIDLRAFAARVVSRSNRGRRRAPRERERSEGPGARSRPFGRAAGRCAKGADPSQARATA